MNQPGGWLFDREDQMALAKMSMPDDELRMAFAGDVEIPPVIDLRKSIPRRSQQNEGSCQGHAQTWASEVVYWLKSGEFKRFSPDFAYYMAQQFDGIRGDSGSTITGGLRVALELGSLEESLMPYTPKYNPGDVPRDAKEKAAPFKVAKGSRLRTYREIAEWYARGIGACWWGIQWGLRESSPGWVTDFRAGGGGHAIGIGMWGEEGSELKMESDGLPPWMWIANSWTNNPQEVSLQGYFRMTRDAIEEALQHPYTVVVGVTDMEQVKPRKIDWSKDSVFSW